MEPGLNLGDPSAGCPQSRAVLMTARAWPPGGKLWFLGLGLTLSMGQGTDGDSSAVSLSYCFKLHIPCTNQCNKICLNQSKKVTNYLKQGGYSP